eukprot:c1290_g1_i1 orf=500-1165(-)
MVSALSSRLANTLSGKTLPEAVRSLASFRHWFSATAQGSFASDQFSVDNSGVRDSWESKTTGESTPEGGPFGQYPRQQGNMGMRNRQIIRGVNKAIIAGEVGSVPVQRIRKNGQILTIFPVGTGGMFRRTSQNASIGLESGTLDQHMQWHKITVHDERMGRFAMQRLKQGSQVYVEGELETRVFNDPQTGMVRQDREIAVRASGRLLFFNDRGAYSIDAFI